MAHIIALAAGFDDEIEPIEAALPARVVALWNE